jgi:hypothetical protein
MPSIVGVVPRADPGQQAPRVGARHDPYGAHPPNGCVLCQLPLFLQAKRTFQAPEQFGMTHKKLCKQPKVARSLARETFAGILCQKTIPPRPICC